MRVRSYALAIVVALAALTLHAAPALAQTVQMEGSVVTTGPDGKEAPVVGAQIDIYRTDIKAGKPWMVQSDKKGRFIILGLPLTATVTIIVSGQGLQPSFRSGVRVIDQKPHKFVMQSGAGNRPTLEEVQASAGTSGPSRPAQPKISAEEAARIEAERKKVEEENAKILANKALFEEKKARFDAGIAAMTAGNLTTTITELSATLEGLDNADPAIFNEMIHKTASNLAEAQYRVAVDHFNKGERDKAKTLLEAASRNISRAVSVEPNDVDYFQIQAKVGELLVGKWNQADKTEATAAAYAKAAAAELDPKKKIQLQYRSAESYRLGYVAESNTTYDEAKVKAYQAKAVEGFKAVLAADPKNPDAIYGIALTYAGSAEKADWQQAANYYKLFVDTALNDGRAQLAKSQLALYEKDFKIKPQPVK